MTLSDGQLERCTTPATGNVGAVLNALLDGSSIGARTFDPCCRIPDLVASAEIEVLRAVSGSAHSSVNGSSGVVQDTESRLHVLAVLDVCNNANRFAVTTPYFVSPKRNHLKAGAQFMQIQGLAPRMAVNLRPGNFHKSPDFRHGIRAILKLHIRPQVLNDMRQRVVGGCNLGRESRIEIEMRHRSSKLANRPLSRIKSLQSLLDVHSQQETVALRLVRQIRHVLVVYNYCRPRV
jgi:hypothetical protein